MKRILLSVTLASFFLGAGVAFARQAPGYHEPRIHRSDACPWVKGYYRKNGTYVKGYWRGGGGGSSEDTSARNALNRMRSATRGGGASTPTQPTQKYAPVGELKMLPQEPTREPSWIRQQRLERAQGLRPGVGVREDGTIATSSIVSKCIEVIDGDTLKISVDKASLVVSLYAIEAPTGKQPFASQSKTALSNLVLGKIVTIYSEGYAVSANMVSGWVFVGSLGLNGEQVKHGLARWNRKDAPDESKLEALESSAHSAHLGIWR